MVTGDGHQSFQTKAPEGGKQMLSYRNPLFFPKLIREGTCKIKRVKEVDPAFEGHESTQVLGLFRLDWHEQEDRVCRKHEYWRLSHHPDKNIPFIGTLPEEYDEKIKVLRFAISADYVDGILWHTRQGLEAWNRNYPFDTIIRTMCLRPAQAHITVAFGLVADCLYDQEQEYWDRSELKQILREIFLSKFWCYQTGRGVASRFSGLVELSQRAKEIDENYQAVGYGTVAFVREVKAFLGAMKVHREAVEESYAALAVSKVPISAPALGHDATLLTDAEKLFHD